MTARRFLALVLLLLSACICLWAFTACVPNSPVRIWEQHVDRPPKTSPDGKWLIVENETACPVRVHVECSWTDYETEFTVYLRPRSFNFRLLPVNKRDQNTTVCKMNGYEALCGRD